MLGFLNPMLYKVGFKGLYDITEGGNIGCFGEIQQASNATLPGSTIIPGVSFNATEGWDPSTGLGVMNFQAMKNLVLSL